MAQAGSRESQIVIADRTFRVCFSISSVIALRDRWKLETDDEVFARLDEIVRNYEKGKLDFLLIADFVWGGLRRFHPEITPEQSLELLDDAGLERTPEILRAVFANLLAASPPQGARQTRPPKTKNGASA